MNEFANPTLLRVGMTGALSGLHYRVAGRVVMGETEDGETYYWNEYHLVDDSGESATLVFEQTDGGAEWKLFMMFDPAQPLTAAEAAGKKVGEIVGLDGRPVAITFVGRSRVYHIEGRAPAGVEIGDVADYFNADTGLQMLVASWTGEEIEFYRGIDVPAEDVARAFNITVPVGGPGFAGASPLSMSLAGSGEAPSSSPVLKVIVVVLAFVIGFAIYSWHHQPPLPAAAVVRLPARPAPLWVGLSGALGTNPCAVVGHALVEIARVDRTYDWHEYRLRDEAGGTALLVYGLTGRTNEWHRLKPAQLASPLTPIQAAATARGAPVSIDGQAFTVRELFQATVLSNEGEPTAARSEFGFLARAGDQWAVARWTQDRIEIYRCDPLPEKQVLEAFRKSGSGGS